MHFGKHHLIVIVIAIALKLYDLFVGAVIGQGNRNATADEPELQAPTATRAELEALAQQLRSDHAHRRATERQRADRFNGDDYECAVCLCEAEAAVEFLPCGHTFCGKCAQQLWEHGNSGGAGRRMLCPLDREEVEAIVPEYKMREAQAARARRRGEALPLSAAEVAAIDSDLGRYNRRNPRRTAWGVAQMLAHSWSTMSFLPYITRVKMFFLYFGPLLYFISPIDIIPEAFVGPLGYVDDVIIAIAAMNQLVETVKRSMGGATVATGPAAGALGGH